MPIVRQNTDKINVRKVPTSVYVEVRTTTKGLFELQILRMVIQFGGKVAVCFKSPSY
jgi:hypothetical protein